MDQSAGNQSRSGSSSGFGPGSDPVLRTLGFSLILNGSGISPQDQNKGGGVLFWPVGGVLVVLQVFCVTGRGLVQSVAYLLMMMRCE